MARDNTVVASDADGRCLSITAFGHQRLKAEIEEGWISRCYGQRELAPIATFEAEATGPQQLISFLIPQKPCTGGPPWPPLIEVGPRDVQEGAATEGRPYKVFSISAGDSRDVLLIGEQAGDLEHEQLTANGSMVWARFIAGSLGRGCLIRGSRFEAGGLAFRSLATVRYCAFQATEGSVEITIQGASRFDLSFDSPPKSIVINKGGVDLRPDRLAARFALEGSSWTLVEEY